MMSERKSMSLLGGVTADVYPVRWGPEFDPHPRGGRLFYAAPPRVTPMMSLTTMGAKHV